MKHYIFMISDYEHEGDLRWGEQTIMENFPKVKNLKSYEERDYEAESEYEEDYGERDEPIYQGYVEFDAPEEYEEQLRMFDL